MNTRVIMVMGLQRSGTTVLFRSLACDPALESFNDVDDAFFRDFHLKPLDEVRPALEQSRGPVLLKPISETQRRSITDVFDEYREYDLQVIWLYRDPVNVIYSAGRMAGATQPGDSIAIKEWNCRNGLVLESLMRFRSRITIVNYEDLTRDRAIFEDVCRRLNLHGKYLFRPDESLGTRNFSPQVRSRIYSSTSEVRGRLDAARTFKPSLARSLVKRLTDILYSVSNWRAGVISDGVSPLNPTNVESLYLWLKGDEIKNQEDGSIVSQWPDAGPHGIRSTPHEHGPTFRSDAINGLPALLFGRDDGNLRPDSVPHIELQDEDSWRMLYDGSSFTFFAVCCMEPYAGFWQKKTFPQLFGTRKYPCGPGFALVYDYRDFVYFAGLAPQASEAIERPDQLVASCASSATIAPGTWHVVACAHRGSSADKTIAIFVDEHDAGSGPKYGGAEYAQATFEDNRLYISCPPGGGHEPFRGFVAELLLFKEALDEDSRLGITGYLKNKYGLSRATVD